MSMSRYTRRDFLKAMGVGIVTAAAAGCGRQNNGISASRASGDRSNILLIMVDDMGYSDIGCYGGEIATPNIDRLAAGGIRFTQFYNAARCCPTRASLLTGLYPHQAGMGGMASRVGTREAGPYQGYLNNECVTIAEVLKCAGYSTYMSGKWHVGESRPHWPRQRGFDKYFGLISGAANYFDITKAKKKGINRQMAIDDTVFIPPEDNFYMTDAITDHALGYVDSHEAKSNPFFMYVAYTAPHWPLHALPEDIEKYRGRYMKGWDKLREQRYRRQIEMGIVDKRWALTPRDETAQPWEQVENKEEMDLKMAVYAAQIDRVDQGIGKILDKLRQTGRDRNTLILFLSDNGGCHEGGPSGFDNRNNGLPPGGVDSYMSYGLSWANLSNTPFRRYKHWVHEGGIATPLIAYWPGTIKKTGSITHQMGHIIDVMATCVEVAGAEYPRSSNSRLITPLEGKSLLPILRGKKRTSRSVLCWEHEGNRAVRSGKWKLVSVHRGPWELYDIETDRAELNDLTADYPQKVEVLRKVYQDWARHCGVLPWPVKRRRGN